MGTVPRPGVTGRRGGMEQRVRTVGLEPTVAATGARTGARMGLVDTEGEFGVNIMCRSL